MKRFVLDTGIILHYIRASKLYYQIEQENNLTSPDSIILISAVTIGELEGFLHRRNWNDDKKNRLHKLLSEIIIIDIAGKDEKLMKAYAELLNFSKNVHPTESLGRSVGIGNNDLWIAALTMVTEAELISIDGDFDHLSPKWIKIKKYSSNNN
jgi:predicted nucleic acid-binding protein